MTRRPARPASRMTAIAATVATALTWVAACGVADDNPTSPSGSAGTGAAGAGTGVGGNAQSCESGDVRECKVDIDANNCFVGVQECAGGTWGPCVEGNDALAIGGSGPCPSNPCNPGCESFDENPPGGITITNQNPTAPPAGGPVNGLDPSWQDAGLKDNNHAYGANCSSSGNCNYDHFCNMGTGNCEPWPQGSFDNTTGDPDFTVPVVCGSTLQVCNRGGVQAPAGVEVNVLSPFQSDIGLCTGFSGAVIGSCLTPSTIDPGQCIDVPGCDPFLSGTVTVHVNGTDQAPPPTVPEVDCANSWGIYDNGGACNCSVQSVNASLSPVDMYVFLDNSGSMQSQGLWNPARAALATFYQDPAADPINVASRFYGNTPVPGCNNSACDANACAQPHVPLDSLSNPAHETALINAQNTVVTGANGTPHAPVLAGMAQWGVAQQTANPTHIVANVYITDGDYNGCGTNTNANVVPLSNAYANNGVLTFAVGLQGADMNFINAVAAAGGTTPIDLTGSSNVNADLTAALLAIQGTLVSCNVPIPNAGQVDPNALQLDYYANGMTPPTTLTQVTNAAACTGSGNDYYADDNANPTTLTLCPATCNTVQNDANAQLEFAGGCIGQGYTADSHVEQYQAACGSGQAAIWSFLAYDTTIPGDATIDFEVRAALTQAQLAAEPWTPVSTATSGSPDVLMSSPVDIVAALTEGIATRPWFELRMTFNPTSNGAAVGTVESWDLQYTCLDSL